LVEATRGNVRFTAPLAGITAANVGVIGNLALFFAYHVLWPDGLGKHFEWPAVLIGLAACIALFRYRVGIIPVIGACARLGWVYFLISEI
jgi:chromate transporter